MVIDENNREERAPPIRGNRALAVDLLLEPKLLKSEQDLNAEERFTVLVLVNISSHVMRAKGIQVEIAHKIGPLSLVCLAE